MIDLLVLFFLLFAGVCVLVGILKFLVVLVLIPFKIALWMTKGLVWLVVGIPFLILTTVVVAGAFPIVVFLLMLPVLLLGAAVAAIARLVF